MRIGNRDDLLAGLAVFLSCFVLAFVVSSLIVQPQGSKAVAGLTLVSVPTMTLSADSGSKTLNPNPATNDGLASASSVLTASTNVPTGYSLALSATAIGAGLGASAGTVASPVALVANTWGYALTSAGAVGVSNGFDASYAAPVPGGASKWANPTADATIKNTNASVANDQTSVYYGAKVDIALPSGTYTSTVTYTATANITTIPTPSITSVSPMTGSTAGGTPVQIVGTGFTVNDQSVTTAVTIDGAACTGVTISSNTPTTGQDTIYCTTPAHAAAGAVSIAVTTWKSTATKTSAYTYIAPTATITTPTANQIFAAGTTSTTLTVTTDIPATCYYGTATNPTTAMSTTGGTTHTQSITGLTNTSTNTRYVRCNAGTNHTYSNQPSVTFYVKAATPAAPATSPASGATVNNGTTTITVTSTGAMCTWGTSSGSYSNSSGTTRTTVTGINTLYYSCIASSGNTISDTVTGSWSYTGKLSATGDAIQTVTTESCSTTRIRVVDARDNATYWVQKMDDGKCWMLTNLAYGGGGTNTYGDVKAITNSNTLDYTQPYYMIPTGSNRTTGTTDPSISTNGTGQYGYLYNWCAAMGAQTGTDACSSTDTTDANTSISVCPSGWRLPTGSGGSPTNEFQDLNNAENGGSTSSPSGLLSSWLGQYSGYWNNGFANQGSNGYYWSSTQRDATRARALNFLASVVYSGTYNVGNKYVGFAVRCVAV